MFNPVFLHPLGDRREKNLDRQRIVRYPVHAGNVQADGVALEIKHDAAHVFRTKWHVVLEHLDKIIRA